jgi:hypothetical protein
LGGFDELPQLADRFGSQPGVLVSANGASCRISNCC